MGPRNGLSGRRVRYHMNCQKVRYITLEKWRDPYTLGQLEKVMLDKQVGYVKSPDIDTFAEQSVPDTRVADRFLCDRQLHNPAIGHCASL